MQTVPKRQATEWEFFIGRLLHFIHMMYIIVVNDKDSNH
jgi:hypothetical protein